MFCRGRIRIQLSEMIIKLKYFKLNGSYYSEGEISLPPGVAPFAIWDIIAKHQRAQTLPGLMPGHSDYNVLVDTVPPALCLADLNCET